MKTCCNSKKQTKKCIRKDGKIFNLPRKFTKKTCLTKKNLGFSMRSSCAPYKYCKNNKQNPRQRNGKKQFLYYPNNPKKSFDVYIDKNPSDTISIKYTTILDVQNTIKKLENLYKSGKYTHKRIWQVGMIMKVRLEAINKYKNTKYPNAKYVNERYNLANKYFKFLGDRTKNPEDKRKKLTFKF